MNGPTEGATSSVISSWASLALALGGILGYVVSCAISPLPRGLDKAILTILLAGQVLAVVAGALSFLLIRQKDKDSKTVGGTVARSACGIILGLCAGAVTFFVWAHIVDLSLTVGQIP